MDDDPTTATTATTPPDASPDDLPVTPNSGADATSAAAASSAAAGAAAKRYRAAPAKTFACRGYGECRMVFSRSEHLARHVRKHTGERPFQCHCGKQFSRLDNLRQHAQTVHADKQEQNERMMRELTTLHTSMSQGAKRDARKKAAMSQGVPVPPNAHPSLASSHPSLHHPSLMQHPHAAMMAPSMGYQLGHPASMPPGHHMPGHVHAQSMSALPPPPGTYGDVVPHRYGRGRPGTSAGYEGSGYEAYDPRRWPAASQHQAGGGATSGGLWPTGAAPSGAQHDFASPAQNYADPGQAPHPQAVAHQRYPVAHSDDPSGVSPAGFREGGSHPPPVPTVAQAQAQRAPQMGSDSQYNSSTIEEEDNKALLGFRDGAGMMEVDMGFQPSHQPSNNNNSNSRTSNSHSSPGFRKDSNNPGLSPQQALHSASLPMQGATTSTREQAHSGQPQQGFRDMGGTSNSFRAGSFRGDEGAGGSITRDAPDKRSAPSGERGESVAAGVDRSRGEKGAAGAGGGARGGAFPQRQQHEQYGPTNPSKNTPHDEPPSHENNRGGGHSFRRSGNEADDGRPGGRFAGYGNRSGTRSRSPSLGRSSASPTSATRDAPERGDPSFSQSGRYVGHPGGFGNQHGHDHGHGHGSSRHRYHPYAEYAAGHGGAELGSATREHAYNSNAPGSGVHGDRWYDERAATYEREWERDRDRGIVLPDPRSFAVRPGTAPARYGYGPGYGGVGGGYGYGHGPGGEKTFVAPPASSRREPASPVGANNDSPFSFHPPELGGNANTSPVVGVGVASSAHGISLPPLSGPGVAGNSRKRAQPDTDFDTHGRPRPATGTASRPQSRRLTVMELCHDENVRPATGGGGGSGNSFGDDQRASFARSQRLLPVSRPGTSPGGGELVFKRPDAAGGYGGRPDTAGGSGYARPGSGHGNSPFAFAHPGDVRLSPTSAAGGFPAPPPPTGTTFAESSPSPSRSPSAASDSTPSPSTRVFPARRSVSTTAGAAGASAAAGTVSPALSAVSAKSGRSLAAGAGSSPLSRPEIVSVTQGPGPAGLRV